MFPTTYPILHVTPIQNDGVPRQLVEALFEPHGFEFEDRVLYNGEENSIAWAHDDQVAVELLGPSDKLTEATYFMFLHSGPIDDQFAIQLTNYAVLLLHGFIPQWYEARDWYLTSLADLDLLKEVEYYLGNWKITLSRSPELALIDLNIEAR